MVFLILLLTIFYLGLPQIVSESYNISRKKSKFEFFRISLPEGKHILTVLIYWLENAFPIAVV